MDNADTAALDGLVIEKVDKVAETKVTIVEKFLKVFLATVGIQQDSQSFFIRQLWFKLLVAFFVSSVSCQFMKCLYLDNIGDIIQTLIFLLHSVFAGFNTFSIYWQQKYILELVKIKEENFSGFYETSLVMRNYITADGKFKQFLVKYGSMTFAVHFFSSVLLPFFHFLFSSKWELEVCWYCYLGLLYRS